MPRTYTDEITGLTFTQTDEQIAAAEQDIKDRELIGDILTVCSSGCCTVREMMAYIKEQLDIDAGEREMFGHG